MHPQFNMIDVVDVTRVMNAVVAGTSDQNGASVNMAGADGVMFVALLGTLTASQVTSLKAQQSSDDGSSDNFSDIAGSDTGDMDDDDDNKLLVCDIFRPGKQYVRPVLLRETANAVIDGIIAIRYRVRDVPVSQNADISQLAKIQDPAEGTA